MCAVSPTYWESKFHSLNDQEFLKVWPLPYLPIFNPLDLASLALFAAAMWSLREVFTERTEDDATQVSIVLSALGFYWLNTVLLRAVHHWANVPYEIGALLHSVIAQAALSLLWTSTALVIMVAAGKRHVRSRGLWMAGAALLKSTPSRVSPRISSIRPELCQSPVEYPPAPSFRLSRTSFAMSRAG